MKLLDQDKCTGCAACYNACGINAIKMIEDKRGFIFPVIDEKTCKQCGKCRNVCPGLSSLVTSGYNVESFAAVNIDRKNLLQGSSGGVFIELAKKVINHKGVVYGCAWSDSKSICHIRVNTNEDIEKLLKSKYMQSSIGLTYRSVREDLLENIPVLFSGTPCQVAGLKSYLGKEYKNLICVDIVCHGVPNQRIFGEFLNTLEKKEKGEITDYCFRKKVKGIGNYATSYTINNNQKIKQWTLLSYGYLFMNSYLSRESCYNCEYAKKERIGDITLGDFWGIDRIDDSFNLDEGVSAVIINNTKGKEVFFGVSDKFKLKKIPYEYVFANNKQLTEPATKPKERNDLWRQYDICGYEAFEKYYKKKTRFLRIKSRLKLVILTIVEYLKQRKRHDKSE